MPAPIVGLIGGLLAVVARYVVKNFLQGIVWIIVSWGIWQTGIGYDLVYQFLNRMNWTETKLAMPDWPPEWTEYICAANGWIPIAEAWVLLKLYLSLLLGSIPARWMHQLRK